jgi:hypothetical protein
LHLPGRVLHHQSIKTKKMKKQMLAALLLLAATTTQAQDRFPKNQLSINAFRNPSIGLEYHRKQVSVHGGYYLTNFTSGVTTEFIKTGLTYWLLPFGKQEIPSSFYVGASYLRGLTRDYKDKNAVGFETGVRFVAWKGLNFRLGVIALAANGESLKINPTPSIGYSIKF